MKSANDVLLCDFCGNSQHVANLLIRGISDAAICDECVDMCTGIITERRGEDREHLPRLSRVARAWLSRAIKKR
ncbi:ClpX C4-type zinc finger protein [Paraburkholderia unamae]|uniref:ClpX C4-type zinc finger protein n=1 Tax=Paraburkholderia unamae TaxID=219649 RepID=UPI000DD38F3D